ncbi:MAG: hypothetical protein NVS3B7_18930 [Candidatus Elarobacter sp.]
MVCRSLALAAVLSVLAPAFPAVAADSPAALRTLVYDLSFSTLTTRREQTSGFSGALDGGSVTAGHGAVDRRFAADDRGKLTVAVVAATADGGLVADVTFGGRNSAQPPVRVAIFRDGRVSYDPKAPILPAAVRLLPFLARGFITGKTVAPGEFWSVPLPPPTAGTATYHVSHVEGERATIAVDSLGSIPGASEHVEGTTTYATDLLAPISLDLVARAHRQASAEQSDTIDVHVTAALLSDTFQNPRS